jgi:23S rRNA-/tRNA-specific pseudouridylate synthase
MSVHNDPGHDLISRLALRFRATDRPGSGPGPGGLIQPVHRLDRETSGVLLLATEASILRVLSEAFRQGRVVKTYLALVHGRVPEPPGGEGIWDDPLSTTGAGRRDPRGKGRLVPARTGFRVLDRSPRYTLLDIRLFTGRQHQIRRHAALAGHPVTGDARYGSTRAIAWLKTHRAFDRLGLHAHSLTFTPPGQAGPVTVLSSGLPVSMRDLMAFDPVRDG